MEKQAALEGSRRGWGWVRVCAGAMLQWSERRAEGPGWKKEVGKKVGERVGGAGLSGTRTLATLPTASC